MNIKRLTQLSLLTATALIIFVIELRIPNIIPIPGIKLGLANIITVYCVYHFNAFETALMLTSRIILGALFSGNIFSLVYSTAGAFFCLCGMLVIRRIIPEKYIWLCSVIGAVLHNTGQIIMAVIVTGTFSVLAYYPILLVSGCIAGFFTGISAQMIIKRIN
ncbi:MAG: Gx transporter family protein [Ruminococcus sp.]|nr:Gx transporter family protein [Ruminococcus sp.]